MGGYYNILDFETWKFFVKLLYYIFFYTFCWSSGHLVSEELPSLIEVQLILWFKLLYMYSGCLVYMQLVSEVYTTQIGSVWVIVGVDFSIWDLCFKLGAHLGFEWTSGVGLYLEYDCFQKLRPSWACSKGLETDYGRCFA